MFRILLILLIVVPALEMWGLIMIGSWIGAWETLLLLLLTGFAGAYLVKKEARKVWHYAQYQMSVGQVPTQSILDGICLFAAGLLLLTPGFFTDIAGFLLVLPITRAVVRSFLMALIKKWISRGRIIRF